MTREEQILKLIVEYFIKTAEPVGSQTLLEEYHLPYSSATIRAEMSTLEKEGYLEKTHTSSGRVPSRKGYTYYVERLREESVDESVKYALQKVLDQKTKSVEEVMKEACEILSNMTSLASAVLGPKAEEEKLLQVQIIPLSEKTATAVFVTDRGYVENKTFMVEDGVKLDEVQKTVTLLNERLKGTPISDLVPKMEAMRPALQDYVVEHDVVYQALLEAFLRFSAERVKLYGKENLFGAPEFAEDTKKLQKVLRLLDDPLALRKALDSGTHAGEEGLNVTIGDETSGLEDLTILSAEVRLPGQKPTSISLLGPTRMDYERAMGLLEYVSRSLGAYFNEEKGENEWQKKTESKNPPKSSNQKLPPKRNSTKAKK